MESPDYLKVPVHDPVLVAVVDALQDLLDAVGGVGLGVELAGHDVLEQLAAGDAEMREDIILSKRLGLERIR